MNQEIDNTTGNEIKVYREKEAAELLGISQRTLARERQAKRISFRRVSAQLRYTSDDLRSYLERNKREAIAA